MMTMLGGIADSVLGSGAIDFALDREDLIDVAHRFDCERRLAEIGQLEKFAPAMAPTCRPGDWTGPPSSLAEIAEPGVSISHEDPGVTDEVPVRWTLPRSSE
jgi:hypothetical protein